jgi:SAM-dependent methyltransferase
MALSSSIKIQRPRQWAKAVADLKSAVPGKESYWNRERGLTVQMAHIDRLTPELKGGGLSVLDVGPGPGHFMVCARHLGNAVFGIDAPATSAAVKAYEACTKSQGLPVNYCGFPTNGDPLPTHPTAFDLIQFKGSFEAALGPQSEGMRERAVALLTSCRDALADGGRVLVLHNMSDSGACRNALYDAAPGVGMTAAPCGPGVTELRAVE